jgi:iron complex transport system substrate-binding protein
MKYNEAKSLVPNLSHKPSVIAGSIYQDIWYLPGGKSYLAKLLQDANANYLWSDNLNKGSLGLSVESVLEKGQNADYWFAPGQHTSYSVLNEEHPLYSKFKATQNNKIFTYSKSVGSSGGVLFFESGACKPDVVLKDIIHHLYPEITKAYTPYYFLPLNE